MHPWVLCDAPQLLQTVPDKGLSSDHNWPKAQLVRKQPWQFREGDEGLLAHFIADVCAIVLSVFSS